MQEAYKLKRNFMFILNSRLSYNLNTIKNYNFQQMCALESLYGRRKFFRSFQKCQTSAAHIPDYVPRTSTMDIFKVVQLDIIKIYEDIRKVLQNSSIELKEISNYYFDGNGKALRPLIAVIIAKAINHHMFHSNSILESQLKIAMTSEMIHVASLLHDDVIDTSNVRRGKLSANKVWGQRKAIFAGDFILSQAAKILSEVGNTDVIVLLSQVLIDLVQAEFMQLGSRESNDQRFTHYLSKTYKKAASLIAFTCQSMAVLSEASLELQNAVYHYGRNLGIAFQLIDDLLDFVSNQTEMGKPTAIDLQLGLANAPVLFACEKYPELNNLIMRRFSEPGDVDKAYKMVMESDGIENTRLLAKKHCDEALRNISCLQDTPEKKALITLTESVLIRNK